MIPIGGLPLGVLRGFAEFWISPTVRQSKELELLQTTLKLLMVRTVSQEGQREYCISAKSSLQMLGKP